jgi:Barstar (barnase inhibitor)
VSPNRHPWRAALQEAVAQQGFELLEIDLEPTSKEELFELVAKQLRFPEPWGRNWDALEDFIGDLSWWAATRFVLVLEGLNKCIARLGGTVRYFSKF